jgi:hypothetical protein
MSTPSGPQDWPGGQPSWARYAGLPPAGVPRGTDSTRVMAIVALVVSGLALAVVVVSQLLPPLMFGAFGGPGPGEPPADSNAVGGFAGTTYQGVVVVAKDATVTGDVLAAAVEAAARGELLATFSCDPAPKAVGGVSVCVAACSSTRSPPTRWSSSPTTPATSRP